MMEEELGVGRRGGRLGVEVRGEGGVVVVGDRLVGRVVDVDEEGLGVGWECVVV